MVIHYCPELSLKKIVYYSMTFGGKYALGMKLYAMNVVLAMSQGHYFAIIRPCSYLKYIGHTVACHNPTVITSHHYTLWQASEYIVVAQLGAFGLHSMVYILQILKACAKHLAYSLMSQAYAKNGFLAGIRAYYIKQLSCF